MASSSSPPPPRSWTYHVFLSFRGEDTRKGFTDHLYAALDRKGIKAFRDDKYLESGDIISHGLLKAIEESMFAITVLSPNYASSAWCLDELQKIIDCSKNMGLEVVPVFYGVEPSEVRHQKGSFEGYLKKHEERFGQGSEKIKQWKDALAHIASYSGWDSKDQHEATLVECIAEHILKKMIPKLPSFTKKLVGIASRVEEVITQIGIGLNDVRFIGIWGMGGIGKTTIARAVYEAIEDEFKVSCFLANVREVCERNNIVQVQKELVAHANISANTFYNEYDGQRVIQNSLCNKKVLLVLDDVSSEVQLKNLAGEHGWFGPGSRIIITTRDIQLLKIHEVHGTYKVRGLAEKESFDLFCLKAFKQKEPIEGYWDISEEVVKYSGGLPLALEVLGSHLYGRPADVWHSAIEKIKNTPFAKIHDTLKISYEGLDFMEKNIFLDIACFFKGMKRDYVTDLLKMCGYNAEIGIAILVDRSLVTINLVCDVLEMHDLLQDMGRNIVIQDSPNNPGKRSRLWSKEDIDLVFANKKGTEAIQGIVLSDACYGAHWSAKAFSDMTQLKLLIISIATLPHRLNYLPTSLKVLHFLGYPLKTLHLSDQQYEVVEIKLQHSKIEQLWHKKKFLGKLKYLELSYCKEIMQTPDVSAVPFLQKLVLKYCLRLTEVHPSVACHKNLLLLSLTECKNLETLPGKLEMSSLKELILDHCSRLQSLPEFGECMKSLSRLSLKSTAIRNLPTSLGCLVGLEDLNLGLNKNIESLPDEIDGLKALKISSDGYCINLPLLRTLNLSYCALEPCYCVPYSHSFVPDFCHFPSLMNLDLSGNLFFEIPMSIHELPKLRCLKLNDCRLLLILPELPSSVRELELCYCISIHTWEFNISSKVRNVFVSPSQDHGHVLLEMLIPGRNIPSWFVHRQNGNFVSIPCEDSLNERLGIVLCFLIQTFHLPVRPGFTEKLLEFALVVRNGNRFITKRMAPIFERGYHLYIICLSKDYFSDGFHQDNCFELSMLDNPYNISIISAARWVSIEDTKDLNKGETERPTKKTDWSIEEME